MSHRSDEGVELGTLNEHQDGESQVHLGREEKDGTYEGEEDDLQHSDDEGYGDEDNEDQEGHENEGEDEEDTGDEEKDGAKDRGKKSSAVLTPDDRVSYLKESETMFHYKFSPQTLWRLQWIWSWYVIGSEYATMQQLGMVLREMGFNPSYAKLKLYMDAYCEKSGDVKLDKISFGSTCDLIKARMQDEDINVIKRELLQALTIFDDSREGFIETSVLKRALKAIPQRTPKGYAFLSKDGTRIDPIDQNREVDELIEEMDPHDTKVLSYERFVTDLCDYYSKSLEQLREQGEEFVADAKSAMASIEDLVKYQDVMRDADQYEAALERAKKNKSSKRDKKKQASKGTSLSQAEQSQVDSGLGGDGND